MPRRSTTRSRPRRSERRLEIRVHSPRIFGFGLLRLGKRTLKLALILAVLGVAGWGAQIGLRRFFIENEEFRLQEIELVTNGCMTERHFGELTGIDPAASVFAIKLGEIRRQLEAIPGIVRVEASRRLPGTLRIRVEERLPVAWVECRPLGVLGRDEASGLLVDQEGFCFPCQPWWSGLGQTLPVVMISEAEQGEVAPGQKLHHREGLRGLSLVCLSARVLQAEGWSLPVVAVQNDFSLRAATSEGAWATFGMYEHERQLKDLMVVRNYAASRQHGLAEANLIPTRNTPVRFAEPGRTPRHKMWRSPENRLERDIQAILNRS